jgi:chromosome segregation ATPase
MPAPYTDPEQDALIDQLLADVATLQTDLSALETRVTAIETTLSILEPDFADAQAAISSLETDSTTHGNNITTLQGDVSGLDTRVQALEDATVPAVDTLQEDVATLRVGAKDRQVNDTAQLGKSQLVLRPSIERVKRPDGRIVQRVGKPR